MKKILTLFLTIMVLSLSGCQLAKETESTDNVENTDDIRIGVPIEFKFEVYDNQSETGYRDVSEYIYYSWLASDDLTYEDLILTRKTGSSMVTVNTSVVIDQVEDDFGKTYRETYVYYEADIYYSSLNPITALYPTITFMKEDGTTFEELGTGIGTSTDVSVANKYETYFNNGEKFTIEFKMNFKKIDILKTVEIREFNKLGTLINTTLITETTLLDEINLLENTDYIFIIETYENQDEEEYTKRLYYHDDSFIVFKYKFITEGNSFICSEDLCIHFPD